MGISRSKFWLKRKYRPIKVKSPSDTLVNQRNEW
jgi:hypothetical protein